MGLTKAQQALITKARTGGAGVLAVSLDDAVCSFLAARIVHDLGLLAQFPELPRDIPPFFSSQPLATLRLENVNFVELFGRLLTFTADADTYFYCLAVLHKARLKYERILQFQRMPTIDQVAPRALLQYGTLSPKALTGWLFWRKWLFDIENRAGRETGYVFEPIIAHAIGGVPYGAKNSPIKRSGSSTMGRQVDCIRDNRAYEIKLRVTIAASGQGRWNEELEFPRDCQASGYTPVLIVLDPTPNPKLTELQRAFSSSGGEAYIGQAAWEHLAASAGSTMATFLHLYVHQPLEALLMQVPEQLPTISFSLDADSLQITVGNEILAIKRPMSNIETNPNIGDDHQIDDL